MRLQRKTALITGAGRGLGAAMARQFAREGAAVIVADKNEATATATAEAIVNDGGRAQALFADVSDPAACQDLVTASESCFGPIHILVNNAGIGFRMPFLQISLEDWDKVLRTNLTSAFVLSQITARAMVERRSGRIINMCSISGQLGSTGRAAYGAAKAALIQLTRVMAVELGPYGIAVNAIAPGPIQTGLTNYGAGQQTAYIARIPEQRLGTAEAVAAAALYLASEECQYVNGHVLNVDGGFASAGLLLTETLLTG